VETDKFCFLLIHFFKSIVALSHHDDDDDDVAWLVLRQVDDDRATTRMDAASFRPSKGAFAVVSTLLIFGGSEQQKR